MSDFSRPCNHAVTDSERCILPRDHAGEHIAGENRSNPRRRARRRVHGDYQARKFWEACVIAALAEGQAGPILRADAALVAWRERWDEPAEPGKCWTCGSPLDYSLNRVLQDQCYRCARPERVPEAGPAVSPFTSDLAPIVSKVGWPPPHRFVPVTGNRYCGECAAGKFHQIHIQEPKS